MIISPEMAFLVVSIFTSRINPLQKIVIFLQVVLLRHLFVLLPIFFYYSILNGSGKNVSLHLLQYVVHLRLYYNHKEKMYD